MSKPVNYMTVANTETGKSISLVEESTGDYTLTLYPSLIVERVRKRSIGKRIREFMKEKIDK